MTDSQKTTDDTERFLVRCDNTADRNVFRYEFLDRGDVLERGSAPHPRIVIQRFDAFKIHRQDIAP